MNKGYIKIALTLLSLAGYTQNVAFASEHTSDVTIKASPTHQKTVFEESTNLACTDIDEILLAINHIMEASELLIKLSKTGIDDYSSYSTENGDKTIYSKKIGNMDIGRLHLTIPSTSNYSNLLKDLWDFDDNNNSGGKFINGNPVRVYSKYLVMVEKLNTDPNYTPLIKKYALAANYKHSNDTIIILCPSRALNYLGQIDGETDMKEMLVNTQPIQTDIDAEEALAKLGTNIAGFVIKTGDKDKVDVTYINAIYDSGNSTDFANDQKERGLAYTNILSIAQRI
ncbi:fam-a protein [Plasmodium yoelii]|uniref:Fam-a protein n=2 Tax=Plasmodium yoelii TaxID=5861 RepID=A0AAE9WUM9_PLAYO|nr:fam-a protein [Plasmodium yoelii]WBY60491.1 fam-a protein [Plasmodium yoelii yoelii]VTZ81098.1 fam-a protein [Plasmodium yoelii]|eukprot:XP_022813789.1 fam-a protein [Plasmodium yoelii]